MRAMRAAVLLLTLCCTNCSCAALITPRFNLDGSEASLRELVNHYQRLARQSSRQRRLGGSTKEPAVRRPNFLVFMTDDQDQLLNTTHPLYMPSLHEHIATQGLQLRSFAVSTSVCCPSRVNFLTGRFAHNTNVTGNISPRGGYTKFRIRKLDRSYLPTWLQSLGYRTYMTGKFLNGFDPLKQDKCPQGWTTFEPLIKPYVLNYWNTAFTTNCQSFHEEPNQYNTDVLLNKTLHYIADAASHDNPFFIYVTPIAPHEGCGPRDDTRDGDSCTDPPYPPPRHADLYPDIPVPESSNFGVAPPDGTLKWVDSVVGGRNWRMDRMESIYRARLRSLKAVDEMIGTSVAMLDTLGILDNTYVIFMSDNGFKIGNHGVTKGKMTAYEEDVRVPFFIRGPGIGKALISDYQATMCDVPATIVDLAGATLPSLVDGTPIPFKTLVNLTPVKFPDSPPLTSVQGRGQLDNLRDQIPHEMWVWGSDSRLNGRDYRALRICTSYLAFGSPGAYRRAAMSDQATFGFRLHGAVPYTSPKADIATDKPMTCYKFVIWCTGTVELYDLMLDPGEIYNRAYDAPEAFINRLNAYLVVQGFCKGDDCYKPYKILHPDGSVNNFADSMNQTYNALYAALPVFTFKQCTFYYYPENEQGWLKYNSSVEYWPPKGAVPGLGAVSQSFAAILQVDYSQPNSPDAPLQPEEPVGNDSDVRQTGTEAPDSWPTTQPKHQQADGDAAQHG